MYVGWINNENQRKMENKITLTESAAKAYPAQIQ